MAKKLNFIIPLVIYPFDVMVSIGQTNYEIRKELELLDLPEDDIQLALFENEYVQGRAVMFSSNQTLIRIRHYPKTPEQFGALAHEIFHAVTLLCGREV